MRETFFIGVVAACLTACRSHDVDQPGSCLPLPGENRWSLIADPAAAGLYWLENLRVRDFDGDIYRYPRLVHFDLQTRREEVVRDNVGSPLIVLRGKLLVMRLGEHHSVAIIDRQGGALQELTPDYLDVADFAPINDHEIVVLADGSGPRAAYTLDLDQPRPKYLADADHLLDSWRDHVFLIVKDEGIAIDLKTGARTSFEPTKHSFPVGNEQLEVEASTVRAHNMLDGSVRDVVTDRADWRLTYTPGAILAHVPVKGDRSEAALVTPAGTRRLPAMWGGTILRGVAGVGPQTWALVGHNTANYRGDLTETYYEADVCLLPNQGPAQFPSRRVPKRYEALSDRLFAEAEAVAPKAGVQFLDGDSIPDVLTVNLKEPAPPDLAVMRARARDLSRRVTPMFGDREIRTEVRYADERVAMTRWARSRLRERTTVAMGDAWLADPAEFELELRDRSVTVADKKLHCSGKLVNSQSIKATGLTVHCLPGDHVRTIAVPDLEPGAVFAYDQTFDVDDDATPYTEVYRGNDPVDYFDTKADARMRTLFELATKVYADTAFALEYHSTKDGIEVAGEVPPSFETTAVEEQTRIAKRVYEGYAALRTIYSTPADASMLIKIDVQTRPTRYEYDGTTLKRVD